MPRGFANVASASASWNSWICLCNVLGTAGHMAAIPVPASQLTKVGPKRAARGRYAAVVPFRGRGRLAAPQATPSHTTH